MTPQEKINQVIEATLQAERQWCKEQDAERRRLKRKQLRSSRKDGCLFRTPEEIKVLQARDAKRATRKAERERAATASK